MKKIFALLLALSLLLSAAALAEHAEEESAPLTREELEIYLQSLSREALADETLSVSVQEDGTVYADFSGGSLEIADETLTESTAVLSAYLADGQEDPRGLFLGSTLEEVLSAYPNSNPSLSGTYYDAALFIEGEKPEISAGYLLRDGQRVTEVGYPVYSWQPDGVAVHTVVYILDQGIVTGIFVGSEGLMEEAEALESIQEFSDMQEISEYFAYPWSAWDGERLAPFTREDLSLLANAQLSLDFLDLDADTVTNAFGPAPVDEWTEDSDGTFLRLMQWDGLSLLLHYDSGKQFLAVDSLTVNVDVLDGPRGVRVGDTLESVIYRFRHGETFTDNTTLALYGDGQELPYGMLNYSPESTEVTYAFSLEDGRSVIWHMTFAVGEMQSMTLALR